MDGLGTEPLVRSPHERETHNQEGVVEQLAYADLRPSEPVRAIANQDGAVLLDIRQGLRVTINPLGAVIWRQLAHGHKPIEIAQDLARSCDIAVEQAWADVREFLDQLIQQQFLMQRDNTQPRPIRGKWLARILGRLRKSDMNGTS
jgi:hypothetical protein